MNKNPNAPTGPPEMMRLLMTVADSCLAYSVDPDIGDTEDWQLAATCYCNAAQTIRDTLRSVEPAEVDEGKIIT